MNFHAYNFYCMMFEYTANSHLKQVLLLARVVDVIVFFHILGKCGNDTIMSPFTQYLLMN